MKRAPAPASRALVALALAFALGGCMTVGRHDQGQTPDAEALGRLSPGMALPDVLASCGPPLEMWLAPDGLMLMWRQSLYHYEKISVDPGRALDFIALPAAAATALSKLKFSYSRGRITERRLVATFDRQDRLRAWAWRGSDGGRQP